MIYTYIGVAAVVGLLVGFVTLSVLWTVKTVGQSIRERSISLLSTYDALLEERSRQLTEMEREIERLEGELAAATRPAEISAASPAVPGAAPAALLRAAERISTTSYRDSGAGEVYRRIRDEFSFDPQTVLQGLPIQETGRAAGPAGELLKELSFETVYRLSTLPGEEQYELLSQSLSKKAQKLLKEYAESHSGFDCISFYDSLKAVAAAEPGPVQVRVPPEAAGQALPDGVQVVVDEDICEGLQVEADNVLYDYCVKVREIG